MHEVLVETEAADALAKQIEEQTPEAEALPEDPAIRAVIFEEGMAILLKEAAKSIFAIKRESEMREHQPDGPTGDGWEFPAVKLAGIEAGFIAQQARPLIKLGRSEKVFKLLRSDQRRLINVWEGVLPAIEKAWEQRDEGDDSNPIAASRTTDFLSKTLLALSKSDKLFQKIANNRARRLGPKAAALAQAHASSLHVKVRKRQMQAIQSAIVGAKSGEEAETAES